MKKECLPIPTVLLPMIPADPKIGSPAYFTSPPRIKMLRGGGCILLDDIEWRNRYGIFRTTPRGLIFDGMSYPWISRKLFGWDKYDTATLRTAAMHDCGYMVYDYLCNWPVSRKSIDVDLYDSLLVEQPRFAWLKYRTVRKVGWMVWGYKSDEPLVREWLDVLWHGDFALSEWVNKIVREKGVD